MTVKKKIYIYIYKILEKWSLTNNDFNQVGQTIRVKVFSVIHIKGVELVPLLEEMAVVGVRVPVCLTSQRPIQTVWC